MMTTTTDSELATLYVEWQRIRSEIEQSHAAEQATIDAKPDWVREPQSTIGHHRIVLATTGLPEERYKEAHRTITELETTDYLAAIEPHEAYFRRHNYLMDTRAAVEVSIVKAPAFTVADVSVKLCIASYWIEQDNIGNDALDEESLDIHERVAMSAHADLERLCSGPPDARESREAAE